MLRRFRARLATEGQRDLPHGVEGGHEGRQRQQNKYESMSAAAILLQHQPGIGQDLILGPEAGRDDWQAGQRQAADQEGPERDRHGLAQTAHVEHILRIKMMVVIVMTVIAMLMNMMLAMLHAMNDRAGRHE